MRRSVRADTQREPKGEGLEASEAVGRRQVVLPVQTPPRQPVLVVPGFQRVEAARTVGGFNPCGQRLPPGTRRQ